MGKGLQEGNKQIKKIVRRYHTHASRANPQHHNEMMLCCKPTTAHQDLCEPVETAVVFLLHKYISDLSFALGGRSR